MEKYIYVLGGQNDETDEFLDNCAKFDINNLKWTFLPNMLKKRLSPGIFQNKDFLYVFGGKDPSIERFDLQNEIWDEIKCQFPEIMGNKGQFSLFENRIFKKGKSPILDDQNAILIFGGTLKEIYKFDIENHEIT